MRRYVLLGLAVGGMLLTLVFVPLVSPEAFEGDLPQAQTKGGFLFFDHLCQGEWFGGYQGAPFPEWPKRLPCPGSPADSEGYVQPLGAKFVLENGQEALRSFETHPAKQRDGFVRGTFSLSSFGAVIQQGDRFMAEVGFLQGAAQGRVRFSVIYDPDPIESGNERQLVDLEKQYDGNLIPISVSLRQFAGQRGDFILRVDAAGSWSQDRAVWVNPRIQPPQPPTSTPTWKPTKPPTSTSTATATKPPAEPPTSTPTPTPTPTEEPEGDCAGISLVLNADPLQPGPDQRVTFAAAAEPGCELERLELWVDGEPMMACRGSECHGEGGPYPDGYHSFTAFGFDDQGNMIFPGNVIIEGQSFDSGFDHWADPIETCPLCPELLGVGRCVEQICTGPSTPNFYQKTELEVSCSYEGQLAEAVQFDIPVYIEGLFGQQSPGAYEDRCSNSYDLIDFHCQGTAGVRELHYTCPYACSNGACLPCDDTDGGYRIWDYGALAGDPLVRADYCVNPTMLNEYYCSGDEVKEKTVNCETCSYGQCEQCIDTDGGHDPWTFGIAYNGSQDYCLDETMLVEYFNEPSPTGCQTLLDIFPCESGCNASIRACNASCSDGVQNGSETGVDCGGNCPATCMSCDLQIAGPTGGGKESGRFSLSDPVVFSTAVDAMMEYADCLRDVNCRISLPGQASLLFKADYDTVTAADVVNDANAIMEAVAFYVTEHMGYVYDSDRPGNFPEIQSAAFTINSSGSRGCLADNAETPAYAGGIADYCGDCEDHAILREALMRILGIPRDCAFCADYYEGYWGGGHTFNIVNYRGKWRIMDYHVLGWYFQDRWEAHRTENLWNDHRGVYWCPDWKDNLGNGKYDAGCNKTHPWSHAWNYEGGDACPSSVTIVFPFIGERTIEGAFSLDTYYSDTCP